MISIVKKTVIKEFKNRNTDKGEIMKEIKLKNGQTLTIAPPSIDDAKELACYANSIRFESKFITYSEEDKPYTLAKEEEWIKSTLNSDRSFIFIAKLDGKIVGSANFGPVSNKVRLAHRCEMGLSVSKQFWGLGIASEIMKVLIEKAKETRFEQIELQVVEENSAARHLYKKFGFYETGFINHSMKYSDGSYAKSMLMQKDLI